MITIQHLLDLGILNSDNYYYIYDDEYIKVMDYALNLDELNKRLIILSAKYENCRFCLNIKPDDYLICRYKQNIETEAMKAIATIRKICEETENCKLCPFLIEEKEKCKFLNTTPFNWVVV